MTDFTGFLTNIGLAKDANSKVSGDAVTCAFVVFSDSENPVHQGLTALPDEVARVAINDVRVSPIDPNVVLAEAILPPELGGFWIRSAGILDSNGDLYAVVNLPPSYKPALAEGSAEDLLQIIQFVTSNAANITLKIDPSVVRATRPWVQDMLMERDIAIASAQMMAAKNLLDNDLQKSRFEKNEAETETILARLTSLEINQQAIGHRAARGVLT